ncbi:hypothetical protein SAMN06297382_2134 [Amphiplicatus metriothermophilus]|uniref:Uncharacterized protein n=1 Tax=Amphiplicatus metriothermophilus TaxID=1519374 RepID=A0A239PVA0_9PROT|nr:hypothetical protein [Amphiplicatus metriothermophilus]SNT74224.1 hypothetical protein SAMN06297382_2134 [Amphiplicatus metriothermophilus]
MTMRNAFLAIMAAIAASLCPAGRAGAPRGGRRPRRVFAYH